MLSLQIRQFISTKAIVAKRIKYAKKHPESFKPRQFIRSKIDFYDQNITFPINIPLKHQYIYKPDLNKPILGDEDHIDFAILHGNQILLYLQQHKELRNQELLDAIENVKIRDIYNIYDLYNHPWVQAAFQDARSRLRHFKKSQIIQYYKILNQYDVQDKEQWQEMESFFKENIPNMKGPDFTEMFLIAYRDDAWRISEEFKIELAKLIPVHMKQFRGNVIGESMEMLHEYGLLSDYLLYDHYYPYIRHHGNKITGEGGLGMVLKVLRAVNYDEFDEFLWQDFYKQVEQGLDEYPVKYLQEIIEGLEQQLDHYKSHSEFGLESMIQVLEDRRIWDESLGKRASELSLAQIVKNDIKYWEEQQKQKMQEKEK